MIKTIRITGIVLATLMFVAGTNLAVYSQCTPDTTVGVGFTKSLNSGCVGQAYADTIHFALSDSITVMTFQGMMTLKVTDVEVNYAFDMAPGLFVGCSNTNCQFTPQAGQLEYGCISVTGTPTGGSPADSLGLNITYTVTFGFGQTFDFDINERVGIIIGPFGGWTLTQSSYTAQFNIVNSVGSGWIWDFGDGDSSTVQNPSHTYASTGMYIACLTVTDTCGTGTTCDTVNICGPIEADFDWDLVGDSVEFTDFSSGKIQNWFWDFGDPQQQGFGGFSQEQNPSHNYNGVWNTFDVCMYVVDSCGIADSVCKQINTFPLNIQDVFGEIKLGPNPTASLLHIETHGFSGSLELLDLYGRTLIEERPGSTRADAISWDLSGFPAGIYIVRMKDAGLQLQRKIIKE